MMVVPSKHSAGGGEGRKAGMSYKCTWGVSLVGGKGEGRRGESGEGEGEGENRSMLQDPACIHQECGSHCVLIWLLHCIMAADNPLRCLNGCGSDLGEWLLSGRC